MWLRILQKALVLAQFLHRVAVGQDLVNINAFISLKHEFFTSLVRYGRQVL